VARTPCSDAELVGRALGADVSGHLGAVRLSAGGTTVIVPHDERPFRAQV
jgi:hypothetical protein